MRRGGSALWLSGLCWSVMFTAFMVAMTLMPVANVLVTMAAGPLLTALFARIFIGHRIAPRTWIAIGIAGAGMAWMYGSQMAGLPLAGTLVALCVPVAAAANWTVVQPRSSHGHAVDLVPACWWVPCYQRWPPCHWRCRCRRRATISCCWRCWDCFSWPFRAFWRYAAGACSRPRDGFAGSAGGDLWHFAGMGGAGERPGPAVLTGGAAGDWCAGTSMNF
jgi:hypothetical protein